MKQILLTLSLLLIGLIPAQAVKKFNPNPINLAIQLIEKTDSANVASTLEYYGYKSQGTEDGYQVLKNASGNEIRYSFNSNDSKSKYPTIIVKITEAHKAIDSRLRELNFEKEGNGYVRMKNKFSKYKTRCSFGPHGTIMIQRIKN